MIKFVIGFKNGTCPERDTPVTKIIVNRCLVGFIYPPGHSSFSESHSHISVFESFMGSPSIKSVRGLFETELEAKKFVESNLENIHKQGSLGLYFINEDKEKEHDFCNRF